jgi:SAM-dependent methyltransferase
MGPDEWDARYAGTDLVWGPGANRWVVEHTSDLPPGRAVDLACGEGRNALFLAERGWTVIGVDFSARAIEKARRLERTRPAHHRPVRWVHADVTGYRPAPVELVLVIYLHLPRIARRTVLEAACAALVPGGHLLVVGHNTRNIAEGVGGPQDPDILYTAADIDADLSQSGHEMVVDAAAEPRRDVAGAGRPAIDTVVLAHRS